MVAECVVRHAAGAYPLVVSPGAHNDLEAPIRVHAPGRHIVVISDETVGRAYPNVLPEALHLTFPAGEEHKTRETWSALTDALLAAGIDRHVVIVGFGGGVTTDLAGFVAATYLRGVPWIAVPTTTLAMCDAAIGGKTGVDTSHGKNLVGAFHQPNAVVIDPVLLDTLPDNHYFGGLAEAVKHAAIMDSEHWSWLEAHAPAICDRDLEIVQELLMRSSALKAAVVSGDEREDGRRAILNAGHTIAHAIEHVSRYAIAHGDAVSIGLVAETRIGESLGVTRAGTADELARLLNAFSLPILMPDEMDRSAVVAAMAHDKKREDGQVRMALLAEIGRVSGSEDTGWTTQVPSEAIHLIASSNIVHTIPHTLRP